MSIRAFARRLLGRLDLPQPTGDRTLNVVVTDAQVPAYGHRCLCGVVAWRVWRAAHEHGCTRIRIHLGPVHTHEFETIDFYRKVVGPVDWQPTVQRIKGRAPRFLATRGFEALGDTFETTRPTFNIPLALAVSGASGGKE